MPDPTNRHERMVLMLRMMGMDDLAGHYDRVLSDPEMIEMIETYRQSVSA